MGNTIKVVPTKIIKQVKNPGAVLLCKANKPNNIIINKDKPK